MCDGERHRLWNKTQLGFNCTSKPKPLSLSDSQPSCLLPRKIMSLVSRNVGGVNELITMKRLGQRLAHNKLLQQWLLFLLKSLKFYFIFPMSIISLSFLYNNSFLFSEPCQDFSVSFPSVTLAMGWQAFCNVSFQQSVGILKSEANTA